MDFPKRQHERLTNAVRAARRAGAVSRRKNYAKFAKRQSSKKLLDASPPPSTREKSSNGAASVAAAPFVGRGEDARVPRKGARPHFCDSG